MSEKIDPLEWDDAEPVFAAEMIRKIIADRTTKRNVSVRKLGGRFGKLDLAIRLANGLDYAPDVGCWEWSKKRSNKGYGAMMIYGKMVYCHRLSFVLAGNRIPDGMMVLHKCDNPPCIRPDHLFCGTASDNMLDAFRKGRHKSNPPRFYGEANPNAKLNWQIVESIRSALHQGASQQEAADRFGISQSNVGLIQRGEAWRERLLPALRKVDGNE